MFFMRCSWRIENKLKNQGFLGTFYFVTYTQNLGIINVYYTHELGRSSCVMKDTFALRRTIIPDFSFLFSLLSSTRLLPPDVRPLTRFRGCCTI